MEKKYFLLLRKGPMHNRSGEDLLYKAHFTEEQKHPFIPKIFSLEVRGTLTSQAFGHNNWWVYPEDGVFVTEEQAKDPRVIRAILKLNGVNLDENV